MAGQKFGGAYGERAMDGEPAAPPLRMFIRKVLSGEQTMNQLQLMKAVFNEKELRETARTGLAGKVMAFLKKNPSPDDESVHSWAEANNLPKDLVEETAYKLASALFAGGKSHGSRKAYDGEQLRKGIEVEMEHLDKNSPFAGEMAKKIASDHLEESGSGKYYDWLKWMEQKMAEFDTPKQFEAAQHGEKE
jgi:hypothetical protein